MTSRSRLFCAVSLDLALGGLNREFAPLLPPDADTTRKDFARMKELGVNCVRVFLSYGSFLMQTNLVSAEGLARFDQFLAIAEEAGIYVHPTGPLGRIARVGANEP